MQCLAGSEVLTSEEDADRFSIGQVDGVKRRCSQGGVCRTKVDGEVESACETIADWNYCGTWENVSVEVSEYWLPLGFLPS